jgi:hypothetical protein
MKPFLAVALAVALTVTLATVALTACSGDDSPSTPDSTDESANAADSPAPVPIKPPRDRACYRLDYQDAIAPTNESEPVNCHTRHTSMTFAVAKARTPNGARAQGARTCPTRFGRFVGGSLEDRRLSMLRAIWFTPSMEQTEAGARWYRCDVIALAREERLARLTGAIFGVLDTVAGQYLYGLCATAAPGTPHFYREICPARHPWGPIATVPFAGRHHPGLAKVRAAGEGPCEDAGRAAADDTLNFQWSYEWPTAEQWAAGQHYGICWAPE